MKTGAHISLVSTYLVEAFDLDLVTERVSELLKGVEYDTLVGTGLSGSLVVPHLARTFGKHYAIVRRSQHHSEDHNSPHSRYPLEGHLGKRWVFVDDMIVEGTTRGRVMAAVKFVAESQTWHTMFVGTVLYRDIVYRPEEVHGNDVAG